MSCKIQLKAMISITPPPYLAMFQKAFKNPLITSAIFFLFQMPLYQVPMSNVPYHNHRGGPPELTFYDSSWGVNKSSLFMPFQIQNFMNISGRKFYLPWTSANNFLPWIVSRDTQSLWPLFKDFLKLGQKYKYIFVGFLVQMKTLKFAFEINWPLAS